ncbi:MAG: NAD-dependent epimerase/dehydratase family protein [Candidatus Gastranaerophilales bacterium]|nr:NAD-dependent epimerase/dehydratase family protein [Candidatus Gastranaerophilales bacterium]
MKQNILLTGGAGFIGSHTADLLIKNGYNVVIVDNLSSGSDCNINKNAKFYNLDINSPDFEKVFKENKFDYVLHFAAQPGVSFSTENPAQDATENIIGTINVLKHSKQYGIKKFITISTAAVYGLPEYLPVDENHKLTCLSFYGLSKLTMEKYTQMFGIDYIIFRFANVYGPRQSSYGEAGVVAIFNDKMRNNEVITINGDGEQTRDFVYVEDVAKVCLLAIQSDVKNEIINVSTNKAVSVNELFKIMGEKYNYTKAPIYTEERYGDIKHSTLDNTKCRKLFDFVPKTSLEDGLSKLVESYKVGLKK